MEKCGYDEEQRPPYDRFLTAIGILAGLGAAPFVFWGAIDYVDRWEPWIIESSWNLVGLMVLGVAWSVFAALGWKRGNPGLRIGLTLVVWAVVAGVVSSYLLNAIAFAPGTAY